MKTAKQRYKRRIVRKYIEFYPTDQKLLDFIEERRQAGIPFASLVKCLLTIEMVDVEVHGAAQLVSDILANTMEKLKEVAINESK